MKSPRLMYFVFCRLYNFSPQGITAVFGSYLSSIYTLLLTNAVSPVRACLSICWERFRGTQKEDDRGPLCNQSSLCELLSQICVFEVKRWHICKMMNLSGSAIRNHVGWLNGSIMVSCLLHELGINHGHERFATGIADPESGMLADCKFLYGISPTNLV